MIIYDFKNQQKITKKKRRLDGKVRRLDGKVRRFKKWFWTHKVKKLSLDEFGHNNSSKNNEDDVFWDPPHTGEFMGLSHKSVSRFPSVSLIGSCMGPL